MNSKVDDVFQRYCDLTDAEKREFNKRRRDHTGFTRNLKTLVDAFNKGTPVAVPWPVNKLEVGMVIKDSEGEYTVTAITPLAKRGKKEDRFQVKFTNRATRQNMSADLDGTRAVTAIIDPKKGLKPR